MKLATVVFASVLFGFCLVPATARAGGRHGAQRTSAQARAASTEVLVSQGGGQYDVTLNPAIITSLFVPEPIERVLASDQVDFTIRQMGNAVAIRPRKADPKLHANLVIVTKTLHITVLLSVSKDLADAQGQVIFRKAEVAHELEARVNRAVAARLTEERTELPRQIERAIAERMFARLESTRLGAINRNDDNIIVKVPRVVRLGDDAYLFFDIQNRSRSQYRLSRVSVEARGRNLAGPVVFEGKAATGPVLGYVAPGAHARAMVVVEDVSKAPGNSVTVLVSEAGGARAVRVGGVKLK